VKFIVWIKCFPLVTAIVMFSCKLSVAQQDDICFIQTSSGQRIPLGKICGKSGQKKMSDFMWDEHNYDPNFVTPKGGGAWKVRLGGAHPFKYPDGSIIYPDGTTVNPDGSKLVLVRNSKGKLDFQNYRSNGSLVNETKR
jgi:hypothetical protein